MKTVSGKVVSVKPVSLSKAAKILSGFAAVENGASDAVSVYLHRASDAFNSLVQFHKDLKNPHSHRKHQSSQALDYGLSTENLEIPVKRKKRRDFEIENEGSLKIEQNPDGVDEEKDEKDLESKERYEKDEETIKIEQTSDGVEEKRKKKKHKKERMKNEEPRKPDQSSDGREGDEGMKVFDEGGDGKKIKQESGEVERDADGVEEGSVKRREKKKRKKNEGEEIGQSLDVEGGKNEERKKRKSGDVDEGDQSIDLAEQSGKRRGGGGKLKGIEGVSALVVSCCAQSTGW